MQCNEIEGNLRIFIDYALLHFGYETKPAYAGFFTFQNLIAASHKFFKRLLTRQIVLE